MEPVKETEWLGLHWKQFVKQVSFFYALFTVDGTYDALSIGIMWMFVSQAWDFPIYPGNSLFTSETYIFQKDCINAWIYTCALDFTSFA